MKYFVVLNEIKSLLKVYKETGNEKCLSAIILTHAADAIEELQAQLPKWISVEEKLPDFEGAVLCMRKSHIRVGLSYQEILYFDYDEQWFKDMFRDFFVEEGCITHWMPLPEQPKEETDG